jgi:hypothetical protein
VNAGRPPVVPGRPQFHVGGRAFVDRNGASRMERTTGRQFGRVRRIAAEPARRQSRRRIADFRKCAGPSSTTEPAYITATRWHDEASTDKSWLINTSPIP